MTKYDEFINGLVGMSHSAKWGIAKLQELYLIFADPTFRKEEEESLERTEFVVKQPELRAYILHCCSSSAYQDGYDRNDEDIIWVHNQWINGKLFTAVSRIILCCGGRITYQH